MRIFFTFSSPADESESVVTSLGFDNFASLFSLSLGTSNLFTGFDSADSGITNCGFLVLSSFDIINAVIPRK